MQGIAVVSTKGGVGKTKVTAGLGRSLKDHGFKVGFLDLDWVAPTLNLELGIPSDTRLRLDKSVGDIIKPVITPEGFPLVSSTFIFPPNQAISADEDSKIKDILELTRPGVIDWGPIDYLMMDTPPSTEKFIQSALQINNLRGVVIVSQPAIASLTDVIRTVSLLRDLQVPIIGLICNQMFVICPHGEKINLYDLKEEDVTKFCNSQGVRFLGSLPHIIPGMGPIPFNGIFEQVVHGEPITLKKIKNSTLSYNLLMSIIRKKKEQAIKEILEGKGKLDG
jgi:ATP-binding protein involved in chromosome partitioning